MDKKIAPMSYEDTRSAIAKPLYGQVRDLVLQRIYTGDWQPGTFLPNEMELAAEFEVSIGTIRRALDTLQKGGMLVRKQGRGTYVTSQATQSSEQRFQYLRSANGQPLDLAYRLAGRQLRAPTPLERARLQLIHSRKVIEITLSVLASQKHIANEVILVSDALAPCFGDDWTGETHSYTQLASHGVIIAKVEDTLRPVPKDKREEPAKAAGSEIVLQVERLAFDQESRPVELRLSNYLITEISWKSMSTTLTCPGFSGQ